MSDTSLVEQESLNQDQINRIFTHRQHLVEHFYDRLNTFLVFESILLGIIGLLYTKSPPPLPLLELFGSLGIVVTIIWWYTQAKIRTVCYKVTLYARDVIPEYRVMLDIEGKRHNINQELLAHPLPLFMLFVWVVLLFFV